MQTEEFICDIHQIKSYVAVYMKTTELFINIKGHRLSNNLSALSDQVFGTIEEY